MEVKGSEAQGRHRETVGGVSGRLLPLCRFRVDNFESVLDRSFVMMTVTSYGAAVLPMVTIMRGCLIGGLRRGATPTILQCRLHWGSLHRTKKRHS